MITTADVLNFMDLIAPRYMLEEWDNAGLLCGRRDKPMRKILLALDPFRNVCEEAIEIGADLIISHHPLIFKDQLMSINDDTEIGRCLMALIKHDICAVNAHTNLDKAPGGVNDTLAEILGLENIRVINPEGTDADGRPYGLLRYGNIPRQSLSIFLAHVKNTLNADGLRYVDSGRPVQCVAVGGGSCAEGMYEAFIAGCDTLVTADIKYNQFRNALDLGLNIIDAGHFQTENPTIPVLARKLQAQFPNIEVVLSENHRDPMKFFV